MNKKSIRIFSVVCITCMAIIATLLPVKKNFFEAQNIFSSRGIFKSLPLQSLSFIQQQATSSIPVVANVAISSLPNAENVFSQLSDPASYSGLPVGKVSVHSIPNSQGVVLLIPQFHRYPGTEIADTANDSAQVTQNQIYSIMTHINETYGIGLVMAEGDLFGEVPSDRISGLADTIELRNELGHSIDELKNSAPTDGSAKQLISDAEKGLAFLDREIILQGAPYKMKAEGKKIFLYGSEVKSTQDESANIVRNYIYLQDREQALAAGGQSQSLTTISSPQVGGIQLPAVTGFNVAQMLSQLKSIISSTQNQTALLGNGGGLSVNLGSRNIINTSASSISRLQEILSTLGNTAAAPSLESELATAESQYAGSPFGATLSEVKNIYYKINDNRVKGQAVNSSVPSRQNNPYSGIMNVNVIESKLKESEQQIQNVVIDQRNRETAENFSQLLRSTNQSIGFLQFGAGHEDGLVEQLNKQGLSVIVITPTEVANRPDTNQ